LYKRLKPGTKGGISHYLIYKFERVYTNEKRHAKPPARYAPIALPPKKSAPKTKKDPKDILKDIPAPPLRTEEELDNMTTKQKLIEAKTLWEGPVSRHNLYVYFKQYYHTILTKEFNDLVDRCVENKDLVKFKKGRSVLYGFPKEAEESEMATSSGEEVTVSNSGSESS